MKKLLFLLLFAGTILPATAQNCGHHTIYNIPHHTTPKVYDKLGTAPQFVPLRHARNERDFLSKLKALDNDKRHGREINALVRSIGYSGVRDNRLDESKVEEVGIPFGAMGMLGESGNSYQYAMIALPKQTVVRAWRIEGANDNCKLYIMNECGNAFYYLNDDSQPHKCPKCEEREDNMASLNVKVYELQAEQNICADTWCYDCDYIDRNTGNYSSLRKKYRPRKVLVAEERIDNIPATDKPSQYPVEKTIIIR